MGLEIAEAPLVAAGDIRLELRRHRQGRALGRLGRICVERTGTHGDGLAGRRVVHAAVVLGQLGVDIGAGGRDGEVLIRPEGEVGLHALDLGGAGVADLGEGVEAQHRELRVLPLLPEQGAVEADAVVRPGGLPPHLIVGQRVGLVGRDGAAAIDAAGAEAGGIGRVDHLVAVDVVGEVDLVGLPGGGDRLVEIGAGAIAH